MLNSTNGFAFFNERPINSTFCEFFSFSAITDDSADELYGTYIILRITSLGMYPSQQLPNFINQLLILNDNVWDENRYWKITFSDPALLKQLLLNRLAPDDPSAEVKKRVREAMEICQLHHKAANKIIGNLSKGFRRRVALAGALISSPEILLLDEPTEGLDPNQKHSFRNIIKTYARQSTVIISTHVMEEVDALADRILLINNGKLISDTTPSELKKLTPVNDIETAFRAATYE